MLIEVTDISLCYSGESIEIIKSIVTEFGGWVDENDCDEIPFYPIGAKATRKTKPVIYITREELNNKFGGIVVIRD